MRHLTRAKTFGRRPDQRKALFRGLCDQLVQHGRIETTLPKAKELRRYIEPLVTLAKRGDLHARRQVAAFLYKPTSVQKLFTDIAKRMKDRTGGYTRVLRSGFRRGDGGETAIIEFVDFTPKAKISKGEITEKPAKKVVSKPKKAAAPKKDKAEKTVKSSKKETSKTKTK